MSSEGRFIQFPLVLLAVKPWDHALRLMFGYSVVNYMEEKGADIEAAREAIGFTSGELGEYNTRHAEVVNLVESIPRCAAVRACVRLKTTIFFDHRDRGSPTEREFKILAAIYSGIGDNPMRALTVAQIQRRAAGCASADLFNRWGCAQGTIFSPKQVRTTVDSLFDSGFFARATYRLRITYYSHRADREELWRMIEKQKLPMLQRRAQRAQDWERSQQLFNRAAGDGQLPGNI